MYIPKLIDDYRLDKCNIIYVYKYDKIIGEYDLLPDKTAVLIVEVKIIEYYLTRN